MICLTLLIALATATVNLTSGVITADSSGYDKTFTSHPESYLIYSLPKESDYKAGNELYQRDKCTTCCRVIFASEYYFDGKRKFTEDDDKNETIERYVMDMEFDDKRSLRAPAGSYEQNILMRPLNPQNELQYFEFAPYNMYTCFSIPKRVHDIRGGANLGSTLIIWSKNPPLSTEPGTQNQRFVFVHPYPISWYPQYKTTKTYKDEKGRQGTMTIYWPSYKSHFYLPFRYDIDLCYEVYEKGVARSTWTGNKKLQTTTPSYQIKAAECSASDEKQMFIPVYA